MTAGERSQGKRRPRLPRSRELKSVERTANGTVPDRDEHGRATVGNALARGRGWKRAIAKMLARDGAAELPPESAAVAEDAWRLFAAHMRHMPDDGPDVRARVASMARHEALEGYWSARALALGLHTPEGIAAQEQASKHGARAERLNVTALDVGSAHAKTKQRTAKPAWMALASVEDDEPDPEPDTEPATPAARVPRTHHAPSGEALQRAQAAQSTHQAALAAAAAAGMPPPRPLATESTTIPTGVALPPHMLAPVRVYSPELKTFATPEEIAAYHARSAEVQRRNRER